MQAVEDQDEIISTSLAEYERSTTRRAFLVYLIPKLRENIHCGLSRQNICKITRRIQRRGLKSRCEGLRVCNLWTLTESVLVRLWKPGGAGQKERKLALTQTWVLCPVRLVYKALEALQETIHDFIQMLTQTRISTAVTACQDVEEGMENCIKNSTDALMASGIARCQPSRSNWRVSKSFRALLSEFCYSKAVWFYRSMKHSR